MARGRAPRCIVLTPTRELAQQIKREFEESAPSLNVGCFYGGACPLLDILPAVGPAAAPSCPVNLPSAGRAAKGAEERKRSFRRIWTHPSAPQDCVRMSGLDFCVAQEFSENPELCMDVW